MNTYSTLKDSVASWLAQDNLTSQIPDFITIAEARTNRKLRIRAMETSTTLSTTAAVAYVALPADYMVIRGVYVDGSPSKELQYLSPEQLNSKSNSSAEPKFFTIRGDNMVFAGPCDAVYSIVLHYYAKFAALSDSNTSNWLTANFPQVLLYGALQAAAEFVHDSEETTKWAALYSNAINELVSADEDEKYGPAPVISSERGKW